MSKKYRIGIIGFGGMGRQYFKALTESPRWELVWVCDLNPDALNSIKESNPEIKVTDSSQVIFDDASLDVVGIFTLADIRPQLIRKALAYRLHIMCEKPIAASIPEEYTLLHEIEESEKFTAVNLFNRNAWYHKEMQEFIKTGEIGQLAIINVSHQTPGLMPTEGHGPEGAPFHDCGMHYVDVARWYANSEYDNWHAHGIKMWDWHEPWWVNGHGCFKNGIAFTITQGFVYGQLAKDRVSRCGLDIIGSLGVIRMEHDFCDVTIEYHGINTTKRVIKPYGGKKIDVMCECFAQSLDADKNLGFPVARDSVIASEVSQAMLDAACKTAPSIGTQAEMQRILDFRKSVHK
jgi:predicted dehydrogenase